MDQAATLITTVASQNESAPRSWWARRIASENPFYVLSAALVIHSTSLSLRSSSTSLPTWLLMGLILGYLLLLAGICIVIVRRWKVWEDARSIPLILVLLLLELSLCLDSVLPQSRTLGLWGLLACAGVAIGVSEAVIRGIRLRLPAVYRLPFYVQLLLCLLPGAFYSGLSATHSLQFVRWMLFAYSALAGTSMLLLIPAAQQTAGSVRNPNCPWLWPVYPWSLPVVVWFCLAFRIVLLTMSFDPVLELDRVRANEQLAGIFSPFWFSPLVLGIGWLLLEAGLKHRRRSLLAAGLSVPVIVMFLAQFSTPQNPAAAQFQSDWLQTVGSPLWCTVLASLAYFVVAAVRGVPGARMCVLYALLPFCLVGPETISVRNLAQINLWPMLLIAVVRLTMGIRTWRSWPALEGTLWLIVTGWASGLLNGSPFPAQTLVLDAAIMALLAAHLIFRDEASHGFGSLALIGVCLRVLAAGEDSFSATGPEWSGFVEMSLMTGLAGFTFWRTRSVVWWRVTQVAAAMTYVTAYWEGWKMLRMWTVWEGLNQFLLGLLLLHVGVAWSAWRKRARG